MADERYVPLPGSDREFPAGASEVADADPNERICVTVMLRGRATVDEAAASLAHRPHLTRDELVAMRGATPEDIIAVERFAVNAGLMVVEANPARRSVRVEGTIAEIAAAFHATMHVAQFDDRRLRLRRGQLSIPESLVPIVTGVFGLDERPQARTHFRIAYPRAITGSFTPPHLAQLYGFPDATGAGQTIALIELGGGYAPADLSAYFSALGITPTPSVTAIGVDGAANAPTGNADSADGEVELDIEVAGSIAPAATIVVYFAPNTDQGFLDAITSAIHDTTHPPTIISISWGSAESTWTQQAIDAMDTAFADAGLIGITVCVAAGDGGSADGVSDGEAHVDFPASSPHVLACGGTTLRATGTAISSEVVWNDTGDGATGGGISAVFPVPAWQADAKIPPSANPGAATGRGVPDVSGDADPATGYQVRIDGSDTVVGGTSAVAPLWAALIARLNQRAGAPFGFINPVLYANPTALRDITSGTNGAYTAGPGWDACTGLGSPDGPKLATLSAGTPA